MNECRLNTSHTVLKSYKQCKFVVLMLGITKGMLRNKNYNNVYFLQDNDEVYDPRTIEQNGFQHRMMTSCMFCLVGFPHPSC